MNDLEKKVKDRFLDRLEEFQCDHPREVLGMAARTKPFKNEKDSIYFKEWLDEAIQQIREGVLGV